MLQRIQSVYLLLSIVTAVVLPHFFSLWKLENGKDVYFVSNYVFMGLFFVSGLLSLISISFFKNRQHQFVLNRLNMILNFILIGLFVYYSLNLSGETKVSEKGIGMLLPLFSIILLALANKAIKKDEDLVKSVDRIR